MSSEQKGEADGDGNALNPRSQVALQIKRYNRAITSMWLTQIHQTLPAFQATGDRRWQNF